MKHTELTTADLFLERLVQDLQKLESQSLALKDKVKPVGKSSNQYKYSEYSDAYFPTCAKKLIVNHLEHLFRTVSYDTLHSKRIYTPPDQKELILTARTHFDQINQRNFFSSVFDLANLMEDSLRDICNLYEFNVPLPKMEELKSGALPEKKETSVAHKEELTEIPQSALQPTIFQSGDQYFFQISSKRLFACTLKKDAAQRNIMEIKCSDRNEGVKKHLTWHEEEQFSVGIQELKEIELLVISKILIPKVLVDFIMSYVDIAMPFQLLGKVIANYVEKMDIERGDILFDSISSGEIYTSGNLIFYFRQDFNHIYRWTEKSLSQRKWKSYFYISERNDIWRSEHTLPDRCRSALFCKSKNDVDTFNAYNKLMFLNRSITKAKSNPPITIKELPKGVIYKPPSLF